MYPTVDEAEVREEELKLRHSVQTLVMSHVRTEINDILNIGEEKSLETVSDDHIIDQITGSSRVLDEGKSDNESHDADTFKPLRAQL